MTNIFDYMTYIYIGYMYNLEPITLSRKNDKKILYFIPKITIRGLLVTFLSEYLRHNRNLSIIFNFRFNTYDKKFEKPLKRNYLPHHSDWKLSKVPRGCLDPRKPIWFSGFTEVYKETCM